MTKEQWIIYIYGNYPNGGFSLLVLICLILWCIFLLVVALDYNQGLESSEFKKEVHLWKTISFRNKVLGVVIPLVLLFFSSLVPNKNTFLLLVATPTVIKLVEESVKDGKLKKLDNILDKALIKLEKDLELKENEM